MEWVCRLHRGHRGVHRDMKGDGFDCKGSNRDPKVL